MHIILPNEPEVYSKLFEPAASVTADDILERIVPLIPQFRRVMDKAKPRAVGLCAPQVGIFERWFMTHLNGMRRFYADPRWDPAPAAVQEWDTENCFSAPGFTTRVERWTAIVIRYRDESGMLLPPKLLAGFEARVFQHECDHLDGKTIFPRDWYKLKIQPAPRADIDMAVDLKETP